MMHDVRLPKLGERMMRISIKAKFGTTDGVPCPCVVIYVNEPHKYYTVKFDKTNIRESYKIPDIDELKNFKRDFRRAFGCDPKGVYVYESGTIYPTIAACAEALGVRACTVSNYLHGRTNSVKGYHVYML